MLRLLVLALFACTLNTCVAGWDDWSEDDKKLFVASNIAIFGDWQTTRDIARRPDEFREAGPIAKRFMGERPTMRSVDLYFIGRFAINYYLADTLKGSNKTLYLSVTTISHGAATIHNYDMGLRIKF
jgi:hypothetical protein